MTVGFSVISRENGVHFRVDGAEGDHPGDLLSLVTHWRSEAGVAVLMGRLYYRDDQIARLTAPADLCGASATNDAALALAVYLQSGRTGLEQLEGDFSLVIWDAREQILIASRDPLGGYPLYWTATNGLVGLATSLPPLVDLQPRRAVDLEYVAQFLMLFGCSIEEVETERTAFEGVQRLLPGHILTARPAAARVSTHSPRDWQESVPSLGESMRNPRGMEDAAAEYGHLLRGAVRERTRGRTASHFSGGMDSTSVALLAADVARDDAAAQPVHAISMVYQAMGALRGETQYQEMALKGSGLVSHQVNGDNVLDFDGFDAPPPHDEPWPWLMRVRMSSVLCDAAADIGANTLLTGLGADELVDAPPYHVADLLRRGRVIRAWREAARCARGSTSNRWSILRPFGLSPLFPASLKGGLGTRLRRGYASWEKQTNFTIPPWVLPGFARRHDLRGRAVANVRRLFGGGRQTALSMGLAAIRCRSGDLTRQYLAAPRGVHVAQPFLDPRLIRFCLGLPLALRSVPGRKKAILAEAMRGVLPEAIRARTRKSDFNEVYARGLSRNLPALEALVHEAPVDDWGLIDKGVLIECLHRAALGVGSGVQAEDRLNLTLALLKWLTIAERRPAVAAPTDRTLAFRAGSRAA